MKIINVFYGVSLKRCDCFEFCMLELLLRLETTLLRDNYSSLSTKSPIEYTLGAICFHRKYKTIEMARVANSRRTNRIADPAVEELGLHEVQVRQQAALREGSTWQQAIPPRQNSYEHADILLSIGDYINCRVYLLIRKHQAMQQGEEWLDIYRHMHGLDEVTTDKKAEQQCQLGLPYDKSSEATVSSLKSSPLSITQLLLKLLFVLLFLYLLTVNFFIRQTSSSPYFKFTFDPAQLE